MKVWKNNIWWGNDTFIKPSLSAFNQTINDNNATIIEKGNIIWDTYNRGTIQLQSEELYTYLYNDKEQKYYFLYPNKTLSKNKNFIIYEVIPDLWRNELLNKSINGILKLTSNEDKILKNNNLIKPKQLPFEIQNTIKEKKLFFKINDLKEITNFGVGNTPSDMLGGDPERYLTYTLHNFEDEWRKNDKIEWNGKAYQLTKWLDGTQLPSKFNDFYVLNFPIVGITSYLPITLNKNIEIDDLGFWKKYKLNGEPLKNTINNNPNSSINLEDPETMIKTILTTRYNNKTELHKTSGWLNVNGSNEHKEKYNLYKQKPNALMMWFVGNKEKSYEEGFALDFKPSWTFITEVWEIDKPFNEFFEYNDEIKLKKSLRLTQGSDRELHNWQINVWKFRDLYNLQFEKEFLISVDEKVILYNNLIIVHKSLIKEDLYNFEENTINLNVNNEENYVIQFQDGEKIELPYGNNTLTISKVIKENGTLLKYEINGDYINVKNVKYLKDESKFIDNQLKYAQLQLSNQENKMNIKRFGIEQAKNEANFAANMFSNYTGIIASGATAGMSIAAGNVAGIAGGIMSGVSSLQNMITGGINYKYDNELRQIQFNLSQNQYAYKKRTMERELEKLNTDNQIVSDWNEFLKYIDYGNEGFIIWKLTGTDFTKKLYNDYLNNVGYETNDFSFQNITLNEPGIYQFSEFEEWSPYNSNEIKSILTNPILIKNNPGV